MRLHIAAIGHAKSGAKSAPEHALAVGWLAKIPAPHRGEIFEHVSRKAARKSESATRIADESAKIIAALPAGAVLIALDKKGKDTSSENLAALIDKHRNHNAARDAVFAIGGAYGHDPSLLARADHVIAFGRATWPHLLCRAMLAEQLYRAEMILARHPYHHG